MSGGFPAVSAVFALQFILPRPRNPASAAGGARRAGGSLYLTKESRSASNRAPHTCHTEPPNMRHTEPPLTSTQRRAHVGLR